MTLLAALATLLAVIGIVQCRMGVAAVRRFVAQDHADAPETLPPVTVLRPLCGDEPLLEEALETCFVQDYPEFQIVFGAQNPADPALAAVARLRRRYPDRDVALVVDSVLHGPNRKISNLINMLSQARHEILVISDSDLHLPPNYLNALVSELMKPGTGMVTALYTGVSPSRHGWAEQLGATQISHVFLPGVLMARSMGRQDCLGSTTMFRRDDLDRTGGFLPLAQVLAEDNVFGQRLKSLGLSIGLAGVVPAATVPEPCLRSLWQHEIRWTRTIRQLAPMSLLASSLQYPLFWSVLALFLSGGSLWSVPVLLLSWGCRAMSAAAIDRALRDRVGRPATRIPFWLFPPRDVLSVIEIVASFCMDEVIWRGHRIDATGEVTAPTGREPSSPAADGRN